jgi:hypothetical protein
MGIMTSAFSLIDGFQDILSSIVVFLVSMVGDLAVSGFRF